MLYGRDAELAAIETLLAGARQGTSGALVVRGEAGIGKTALLERAAAAATSSESSGGMRVLRGAGVESEAELPFAALHLLLRPVLDRLGALPAVQADALRAALGLTGGGPRDRFLVGLAVLSLLSELAEDRPVLCLVDDAHALDRASADALLFAARRLDAEGVVIVMAARDGEPGFAAEGLPELRLRGLDARAAGDVLTAFDGVLSHAVRYRVLAESAGNPLALIELPKALTASSELATTPDETLPLTERLRAAFQGQVDRLPEATRVLLLLAALEEGGDLGVVLRAGERLAAVAGDLVPAERAGLIRVGAGPEGRTAVFRHPLLRTAVRFGAPLGLSVTAHEALAAVLDRPGDADRRAWHLAAAATGPDERIAADLERTAVRARERGGYTAAATAYERAARLTAEAGPRDRRLALAAEAAAESGDLERAGELAERAARTTTDPDVAARLTEVRATASFWRGAPRMAFRLLMDGAGAVPAGDPHLAASMLMEAAYTGWYTGEHELSESVDRLAAVPLPNDDPLSAARRLLLLAAAPAVGQEITAVEQADPAECLAQARAAAADPAGRVLVSGVGLILGQDTVAEEIAAGLADDARGQGRVGWLPQVLFYLATAQVFRGRHAEARTTTAEALTVARDTDQRQWRARLAEPRAYLAAAEGDEELCRRITDAALTGITGGDPTWEVPWVYWALGLLDLGLGRAESALSRLEMLERGRARFHIPAIRSTPDLVEAAVRLGRPDAAAEPFAQYERWARNARQPWIDATVLRCQALLAPDAQAEVLYTAALRIHERAFRPFDEARTALLYGEWLRRGRRKAEARPRLQAAIETFERLGATPWADRARAELGATGAATATREYAPGPLAELTPQELAIVRLAASGLSNRDIAARLFLSPRTVGYHLYKAYPKLGVASRGELTEIVTDGS